MNSTLAKLNSDLASAYESGRMDEARAIEVLILAVREAME